MFVLFNVDAQQLQIYFLDIFSQMLLVVFQSQSCCMCASFHDSLIPFLFVQICASFTLNRTLVLFIYKELNLTDAS